VAFVLGAMFFHEKNIRRKALILSGIIAGVMILAFGSK
jgi:multidrug transporter EmrE-like cation transporter